MGLRLELEQGERCDEPSASGQRRATRAQRSSGFVWLGHLVKAQCGLFPASTRCKAFVRATGLNSSPPFFSIGYGGGLLAHNPNLAEDLPVNDAPLVVASGQARFVPDPAARLQNGGFENFARNQLKHFDLQDAPGVISFTDTGVKHRGQTALRLENFQSDPHGHGRVMQAVPVTPHRCSDGHDAYYLMRGSFAGAWNNLPRDIVMCVWGGEPRPRSLQFFAAHGFSTLVASYYDADNLDEVKGWMEAAAPLPSVPGLMYAPWTKKYDLLPAFGNLLR